jgi:hypothetical protein
LVRGACSPRPGGCRFYLTASSLGGAQLGHCCRQWRANSEMHSPRHDRVSRATQLRHERTTPPKPLPLSRVPARRYRDRDGSNTDAGLAERRRSDSARRGIDPGHLSSRVPPYNRSAESPCRAGRRPARHREPTPIPRPVRHRSARQPDLERPRTHDHDYVHRSLGLHFTGSTVHPVTRYAVSGLGATAQDYASSCRGATLGEGLAGQGEALPAAGSVVESWLQRNRLLI